MLVMHDVCVNLGRLRLGPIHLRLAAGERVAILGPSGAGKSTLLRLMARELKPTRGDVLLDRRPLAHWSASDLARRRAVLPQHHGVAFGLPVELVVALGRVARQGDAAQDRIVQEALVQAQAEHLQGRRFDTLSGGEQARVQLARVLAQAWDERNGLLLVDEPLAAMDPGLTLSLMQSMRRFAAARGHALVAVLHDLNLAMNHFDRLWMVKDGQLIADCDALPSTVPLLEQLYGTRLRLLQDEHGVAVLPVMGPEVASERGVTLAQEAARDFAEDVDAASALKTTPLPAAAVEAMLARTIEPPGQTLRQTLREMEARR